MIFEEDEFIHNICERYNINKYTINSNGSIDVDGNVELSYNRLKRLPIKFNYVSGSFDVSCNMLTTLEGLPKHIGGYLNLDYNHIEVLNLDLICDSISISENIIKRIEYINPNIIDNIRIHNNQGIISKYKRSLKIKQFLKDES